MGGAVSTTKRSVTKVKSVGDESKEGANFHPPVSSPSASNLTQQNSHNSFYPLRLSPRDQGHNNNNSRGMGELLLSPYELNRISSSPFNHRPSPMARLQSHEPSPVFSTPSRQQQPLSDGSRGSGFHRPFAGAASTASHHSDEDNNDPQTADLFAHTALSLGLDGDDLLFNMMYFDDGNNGATFGQVLNTMQQETLALHSEHNTPYRLHPADEAAIAGLVEEEYLENITGEEKDCQVCKDEIENGSGLLRIPHCQHYFHQECLLRWIKMQAWCPVCRSSLQKPQAATMEALVEVVEGVSHSASSDPLHHHYHHHLHQSQREVAFPFPTFSMGADGILEDDDLSPLSRKLAMEEQLYRREEEESGEDSEEPSPRYCQAEGKLPASEIQFYDLDAKDRDQRKRERALQGKNNGFGGAQPPPSSSLEHQLATESADKVISEAMRHLHHQEKLVV